MNLTTIFVRLQDEGIDVWRPVESQATSMPGVYILDGRDEQAEEIWQFAPGSRVEVEEKLLEGDFVLVAVREVSFDDS